LQQWAAWVSKKAQLAVHIGVLLPTLMYGSESWVWQKKHTSRVNVVEIRALRSMIGVKLSDRVRNEVIRAECGVKEDVVTKIETNMLRWLPCFGRHVKPLAPFAFAVVSSHSFQEGLTSSSRPVVKIIAESLSQRDETDRCTDPT
jgi:hypothetical protein